MAFNILSGVIKGVIELDRFYEWLSGKETEGISPDVNRAEFALHVLNCIQKETNKFLLSEPPTKTLPGEKKSNTAQDDSPKNAQPIEEYNKQKSCQRTPFQIVNQASPIKTITPKKAGSPIKTINHLLESRPHPQKNQSRRRPKHLSSSSCSASVTDSSREIGMKLIHSTPQSHIMYESPFRSPDSSGSHQSDNSSLCHTPHSRGKGNYSGGSYRVSPASSNSSSFSPMSPKYADNFPDLGSRERHRASSHTPCLGNFIVAKPASKKGRKRIKPTQLTTVMDKESENDSKKGINKFGSTSRPFVPIDAPQSEVKKESNYEEERNLLKQKRTESLNTPLRTSTQNSSSSLVNTDESIEEKSLPKQNENIRPNNCGDPSGLMCSPESSFITPDPSMVTCMELIERLANVYSACFDKNLVPNLTSELYFIFTIITSDYKAWEIISIDNTKTQQNIKNEPANPTDNAKRKITFTEGHEDIHLLKSELERTDCYDGKMNSCIEDEVVENGDCFSNVSNLNTVISGSVENETEQQINIKTIFKSVHNCVMFAAILVHKQISLIQCLPKNVIRLLAENSRMACFVPNVIPRLNQIMEEQEVVSASCPSLQKQFASINGPIIYQSETDSKENFSSQLSFNSFKKQRDTFYEILYEWNSKNTDNNWITKRFPQRTETLLSMSSEPVNMMHLARLFCAQLTNFKEDSESDKELELPGVTKDKLSLLKARFSKPTKHIWNPRPPPQFPAEQQFYKQFLLLATGTDFLTHVADCLICRINQLDKTPFFIDGISPEVSQALVRVCVSDCCLLAKFLGALVFSPYITNEACPPPPDLLNTQVLVRQQSLPPVDLFSYLQQALASNRLVVTVPWIVAFLGMMDPVSPYLPCYQPLLQSLAKIYLSLPLPHLSPLASFLLRSSLGWLFDPTFFPVQVFCSLTTASVELPLSKGGAKEVDADTQNVVDIRLVSELCPGLGSLQMILSSAKKIRVAAARHITPVPALISPAAPPITAAQTLELQLEESFFNGQSPSFRATVEFVVDRLSSSCIKYICRDVITSTKEEALKSIKKEKGKKLSKEKTWIETWCAKTGELIETAVADYCGPHLTAVLPPLLGPEASVELKTTQAICSRRCRERIITWLNSHFNFPEMFTKLLPTTDVKPTEEQPATPSEVGIVKGSKFQEHRDSVMSPPDITIKLQDILCHTIETGSALSNEEAVLELIKSLRETLSFRNDLTMPNKNMLHKMSLDLSVVLIAHKPRTMTNKVFQELCQMWKISSSEDNCVSLISPRNALLLCQGGPTVAQDSWMKFSELLVSLMKMGLITPKQLEGQWVALLHHEWPRNVLALFETCLNSILEKIKNDPVCSSDPKFVLVLEWIGEISKELAGEEVLDD